MGEELGLRPVTWAHPKISRLLFCWTGRLGDEKKKKKKKERGKKKKFRDSFQGIAYFEEHGGVMRLW